MKASSSSRVAAVRKASKAAVAALFIASVFTAAGAQAQTDNRPPVKKIEVTGSAEVEITPDILYLDITLREYKTKNGKVEISTLEKQLQKAVQDAGIAKEDFTIANVFGSNYDWWYRRKKNDQDFMARKQYRLKLNKLDKINAILGAVDAEGIESVNTDSYTHSKMEDYRREVKTKALQAAKAKAEYMLEGIGSKTDGVLEVQEINTDNYADERMANTMMAKGMLAGAARGTAYEAPMPNIDFKTIKVRAEVRAVFFIK